MLTLLYPSFCATFQIFEQKVHSDNQSAHNESIQCNEPNCTATYCHEKRLRFISTEHIVDNLEYPRENEKTCNGTQRTEQAYANVDFVVREQQYQQSNDARCRHGEHGNRTELCGVDVHTQHTGKSIGHGNG